MQSRLMSLIFYLGTFWRLGNSGNSCTRIQGGENSGKNSWDTILNSAAGLSMVSQELPTEEYRSYSALTLDNGTENARHSEITEAIGAKCYFAHPYSSWE